MDRDKFPIELEAAEALMDVGVSIPLKSFRILFTQRWITFRLTMKRPMLWNLIKIASLYLEMNTTYDQMKKFKKEEEMAFIRDHGRRISRIIALTIFRDGISGSFYKILAWFIERMVPHEYLQGAFRTFISLMGVRAFTAIIRSVETANPMKPKLSQRRKGS
jgi:hypothetical protein